MLLNDLLPVIACNSDLIITERNMHYDEFSDYNEEPEYIQLFNSHVDRYAELKKFEFQNYLVELVTDSDLGIKILVIPCVKY